MVLYKVLVADHQMILIATLIKHHPLKNFMIVLFCHPYKIPKRKQVTSIIKGIHF